MVQPKTRPTGPVTLKICTGPIRSGPGPLDGEVKLKNADSVVTGHYTARPTSPRTRIGGGDGSFDRCRRHCCRVTRWHGERQSEVAGGIHRVMVWYGIVGFNVPIDTL